MSRPTGFRKPQPTGATPGKPQIWPRPGVSGRCMPDRPPCGGSVALFRRPRYGRESPFYSGDLKSEIRLPAMSKNMAIEPKPPGISVGDISAVPPRLTALSR